MSNARQEFRTVIHNEDYIVRDHHVHDVRIMPGVTFIDVIYRCLAAMDLPLERCGLEKMLFERPVATSADFDQELSIAIEPRAGSYSVEVSSRRVRGDHVLDSRWFKNAYCEARERALAEAAPRLDLARLKRLAVRTRDMDDVYAIARAMDIRHFEFMQTLGTVHQGADYVLAEVRLSDLAARYAEQFVLHPALMDASTLPYAALLDERFGSLDEAPFIPIYFEGFGAVRALPREICVYVRAQGAQAASSDVIYTDIEVCDTQGERLMAFSRLGGKRIRSRDLITRIGSPDRATDGDRKASVASPPAAEHATAPAEPSLMKEPAAPAKQSSHVDLRSALIEMVATRVGQPAEEVSQTAGFYDQGLESKDLLAIVTELEGLLGRELYPTLLFEHGNIADLADHLNQEYGPSTATVAPSADAAELKEASDAPRPQASASAIGCYRRVFRQGSGELSAKPAKELLVAFVHGGHTLAAAGAGYERVVRVLPGADFGREADGSYRVRPESSADLEALCNELELANSSFDVVHLWRTDELAEVELSGAEYGFEAVGHVVRGLLRTKPPRGTRFLYCTRSELEDAVAGFLRSARRENPKLEARLLRLDPSLRADELDATLARELRLSESADVLVRIDRTQGRLVQGLERFVPERSSKAASFRAGGTYVITGGLGGLGLIVAEQLARTYRANLLLVGRSPVQPAVSERIDQLRKHGARVLVAQADVGELADVRRALRQAKAAFRRVDGVIHCAGVTRDELIVNQDPARVRETLRAKVEGTRNLDQATAHDDLDCFILFSSLSAQVGNVGQSDYALANAFMDAFADARARMVLAGERRGRTLSIGWPLWEEGGMAPDEASRAIMEQRLGLQPLASDDGLRTLEQLLACDPSYVAVVAGGSQAFHASLALHPVHTTEAATLEPALADARETPCIEVSEAGPGPDDIAIIGVSGRYPMAEDLTAFWQNLCDGRDCISEIPAQRWDYRRYFSEQRGEPGKHYGKWGGFLDGVDEFDPLLFNVSPQEASSIDPQARLFLQCAWSTMEDAGYAPLSGIDGRREVGVFAGVMWRDYELCGLDALRAGNLNLASSSASSIANRVSYALDLRGPSVPVDTMCSSSLTAIHLACESIRRGECSMAIAGGVNLSLHPYKYLMLSRLQMLASDGRCRSYGEGGDGYVPGEGVGAVLLKRLDRAILDGDHIHAVIKASAVNHGGRTSGITVPNPRAQAEVVREAQRKANVPVETITYVEGHGTGTSLGDPIEVEGLRQVFDADHERGQFCALGSVKSNIGHLEGAAGIAALTKVLLQMKHRELVPSLHSSRTNSKLQFDQLPFRVPQHREPWTRVKSKLEGREQELPLRAGVSSFGAGGVNVHVVLEEYVEGRPAVAVEEGARLIVLSAANSDRLREVVSRLSLWLDARLEHGDAPRLGELAYTLQVGREPLRERLALQVRSLRELSQKLRIVAREGTHPAVLQGRAKPRGASPVAAAELSSLSLDQVARAFVAGSSIPWSALAGGTTRRVPLPTYPFARERYWAVSHDSATSQAEAPKVVVIEPIELGAVVELAEPELDERVHEKLLGLLQRELSNTLELASEHIEPDEPLATYGVDSLLAMRFIERLSPVFGRLSAQVLLRCETLEDLAQYLLRKHADDAANWAAAQHAPSLRLPAIEQAVAV